MVDIRDQYGNYLATMNDNGDFYHNGTYIGSAKSSKKIYWNGRYVAHVTRSGAIMRGKEHLGYVKRGSSGGDSFFGLDSLGSLLISPLIFVLFGIGTLLWFLTDFVQKTGRIATAVRPFNPIIWGAGLLGLAFLIIRRIAGRDAPLAWMSIAGTWLVFLSASWIFAYQVGLIAVWAFPVGFAGKAEYDPLIRAGLVGCPGAQKIYEGFQNVLENSDKIILNRGLSGLFDMISNIGHAMLIGGKGFLLALLSVVLSLIVQIVLVALLVMSFIFLVPLVSLLTPFLPAVLLLALIGQLLSIGWE